MKQIVTNEQILTFIRSCLFFILYERAGFRIVKSIHGWLTPMQVIQNKPDLIVVKRKFIVIISIIVHIVTPRFQIGFLFALTMIMCSTRFKLACLLCPTSSHIVVIVEQNDFFGEEEAGSKEGSISQYLRIPA